MATPAAACKKALKDATLRWPERNRASDGIMGDTAHQQRKSDHNLGNAFDLGHDPEHGVDCNVISRLVIDDPRVTYVIWNAQIYKRYKPEAGWAAYTGPNKHTHHCHVSIKPESRDDLSPWPWSPTQSPAVEPENPTLKLNDTGPAVKLLQAKLGIPVNGVFGLITVDAVKKFQAQKGLVVDGIVGKKTWATLK